MPQSRGRTERRTMRIRAFLICGFMGIRIAAPGQPGTPLLLTGAALLDPTDGKLGSPTDVLIVDGRIRDIGGSSTPLPAKVERVDLTGLTLIPGLIDLHTHLLLHPYNETSWDDQVLRE